MVQQLTLLVLVCFTGVATAGDWKPLFDGTSFDGWTMQDGSPVDADAWEVSGGMIHLDRSKGDGGNLLTEHTYRDFELIFEWIISEGGNNGIKYRVNDFDGRTLGIEYQMIDDFAKSDLKPKYRTASLYDIYEPKPHHVLNPSGTINRGRIVVRGDNIQHWLNGHLVTEARVGSNEWKQRMAESKFADVEGFGLLDGRIMLTDHNDEVWYRNIFIRELDAAQDTEAAEVHVAAMAVPVCCCPPPQPRTTRLGRFFRRRR